MHSCGFRGSFISKYWGGLGIAFLLLGLFPAMAQPEISKQPVDLIGVALGAPARFAVEAVGDDKLEYQWRLNGVNLPGATDAELRIEKLNIPLCGTYTVAVTDSKGSINSGPARLVPEIKPVQGADLFLERIPLDQRNEFDPLAGLLRADTKEATKEAGEPMHAGRKGGASIWFSWIAPESGIVQFSAQGSGFDTLLAAYRGESLDKLERISRTAEDDDRGGFSTSEIKFNVVKDTEYAIALDGYEGVSGIVILRWSFDVAAQLPEILEEPLSQVVSPGEQVHMGVGFEGGFGRWFRHGSPTENTEKTFIIDQANENHVGRYFVEITEQERHTVRTLPANIQINLTDEERADTNFIAYDKFLMATDRIRRGESNPKKGITASAGPSRGYTTTQIFSTIGSTKDPGEPNHAGVAGGASEWFVYLAPESGTVHVNTDGSNFDTVVAVYTGGGFDYASLVPVGSHNNPGVNGQDRVRFAATAGTSYFIAVDGVGGMSGSVKLNVHLGTAPVISSAVQNRTVGVGSNATFTVTATGVPAVKYQWRFNGTNLVGATSSSYVRSGATLALAGTYSVVVSNTINTVAQANTLTVLEPPAITSQPANQTVAAGAIASFSVIASGGAPLRYQWRFTGTNLPAATNSVLSITNVQADNVGQYSVLVTNSVGSVTSSDATLSLSAAAPVIVAHPASKTVAPNATITLLVSATGSPAPAYQWELNNIPIGGATAASLVISNFQQASAGSYRVAVTNSVGSVMSNPAVLALNNPVRTDSFTRGTNGAFELEFIGEADTSYVLEGTTNLVDWTPLMTNSSPSGFVILSDTNATGFGGRFYRVVGP